MKISQLNPFVTLSAVNLSKHVYMEFLCDVAKHTTTHLSVVSQFSTALNSKSELMIHCKEYYLIDSKSFHQQIVPLLIGFR